MSKLVKNDRLKVYCGGLTPGFAEADLKQHFSRFAPVQMELKSSFAFIEFAQESDAQGAIRELNDTMLLGRRLMVRPPGPSRQPRGQGPPGPPGPPGPHGPPGHGPSGPRGMYQEPPRYGYGDRPPAYYERDYRDRDYRDRDRGRGRSRSRSRGRSRDRSRERDRRSPVRGGGSVPASGYRVEVENISARTSWQDLKDFGRQAGATIKHADLFPGPNSMQTGVISFATEEDAKRAVTVLNEQELDGAILRVYPDRGTHSAASASRNGNGNGNGSGDRYQSSSDRYGPPRDDRYGDRYASASSNYPATASNGRERRRSPSYERRGGGRSRSRDRERERAPVPPVSSSSRDYDSRDAPRRDAYNGSSSRDYAQPAASSSGDSREHRYSSTRDERERERDVISPPSSSYRERSPPRDRERTTNYADPRRSSRSPPARR